MVTQWEVNHWGWICRRHGQNNLCVYRSDLKGSWWTCAANCVHTAYSFRCLAETVSHCAPYCWAVSQLNKCVINFYYAFICNMCQVKLHAESVLVRFFVSTEVIICFWSRRGRNMKIAVSVFVFGWYKQRKDHSIYGPVQVLNDSPNRPPAIEMAHQFNYFTT